MTIKLEPGKEYRRRDGKKCWTIGRQRADSGRPWVVEDEAGNLYCLRDDGRFLFGSDYPRDIESEWTEPRTKTVTVRLYSADDREPFATVRDLSKQEFTLLASARVTLTEGVFVDE